MHELDDYSRHQMSSILLFCSDIIYYAQMHVCLVTLKSCGVNQDKLGLCPKLTRVKGTWIAF